MKANHKAKIATKVIDAKTKKTYVGKESHKTSTTAHMTLNTKPIWNGQPNPKYKKTKYEWLFLPISWFIIGVAIFWMRALRENFWLWLPALILLLFGLYCVFFRNHFKKRKRKKYAYEVTSTDLNIIFTKKKDIDVRQLPLENIHYVAYTIRKNGVGTIYFNFPNDYKDLFKLIFAHSGLGKFDEKIFCFFEIEDAEDFMEKYIKPKADPNCIFEKI